MSKFDAISCESCGKGPEHGKVMMPMQPGPDGKAWGYCTPCYVEGIRPYKVGNIPAEYKEPMPTPRRRAG